MFSDNVASITFLKWSCNHLPGVRLINLLTYIMLHFNQGNPPVSLCCNPYYGLPWEHAGTTARTGPIKVAARHSPGSVVAAVLVFAAFLY